MKLKYVGEQTLEIYGVGIVKKNDIIEVDRKLGLELRKRKDFIEVRERKKESDE